MCIYTPTCRVHYILFSRDVFYISTDKVPSRSFHGSHSVVHAHIYYVAMFEQAPSNQHISEHVDHSAHAVIK